MQPSFQDAVATMVLESVPDDDVDDEGDEDQQDCDELNAVQDLAGVLELQFVLAGGDGHVLWIRGFEGSRRLEKLSYILYI